MKKRCLILSDVHYRIENYDTLRVRDALIEKLNEKGLGYFKYIFITGDFLYQYEKDGDFRDVSVFLEKIVGSTGVDRKNIYVVPGNHDIQRNQKRAFLIEGIKSHKSYEEIEDDTYNTLMEGQRKYIEFYNEFLQRKYNENKLHYLISDDDISVLGINSCLISGLSKDDDKDLSIDLKKLFECIKSLGDNKDKINIAIIHHSLECLNEHECEEIKKLLVDNNFYIIVSGHTHKKKYEEEVIGDKSLNYITSGAIVKDDYADVSFVELELDSDITNVFYYSWVPRLSQWKIDNGVSRKADDRGIISFKARYSDKVKNNGNNLDVNSNTEEENSKFEDIRKEHTIIINNHGTNNGVISGTINGGINIGNK